MKKRMFVWMLSFIFVLSTLSLVIAQDKPKVPTWQTTPVKEWVAKAKASITRVTPADVKAAIDKKEKAIILDVRDPDEYKAGHIPGAVHVSRGKLEFTVWDKVTDRNAKIYVYCLTAARSALATKALNDMGYKNAVLMDSHFEEWIKAGYPVER